MFRKKEMEEVKSPVKTEKCPVTMGSYIEKDLTFMGAYPQVKS